ncbi:MAG: T9SS type A sorting domain-containing protein [Bacteroidales bacterium]|nr:T9SS type A sorting domain-containing protein [Bacteroidales bacterium]
MKKHVILLGILGLILNFSIQAQVWTKYSAGFEPGSATNYTITGSSSYSTTIYSGGSQALLLQQSRTDDAVLLLDTIDLTQASPSLQYATLEFMHICKVRAQSTVSPITQATPFGAIVEVRRVDEENWTQLRSGQYDMEWGGGSSDFNLNGFFSDYSYSQDWAAGNNVTPNNSMWKKERFNLGSLFSSARQENRKLLVRFKLPKAGAPQSGANGDSRPIYHGWLLDNIVINASPSSLAVPVIKMLEYPVQVSSDPANHPTSRDVVIKADILTSVAQGLDPDSVYIVYKLGAQPYSSVNMVREGTSNIWVGKIPYCGYDTLVAFRLVARDGTTNHNKSTFPNDESAYSYYKCVRGQSVFNSLGTSNSSTSSHPFPSAGDSRSEYVYDKAILSAAGYTHGAITSIRFRVASGGGTTLNNFEIKMQNVGNNHQTSASSEFSTTSMKTVYSGNWRVPAGTGTIATIELTDTFYYSGNDILLQMCYDNASDGTATSLNMIPTVANKGSLSIPLNASWGMNACTYINGTPYTARPQFEFKMIQNLPLMKDLGIANITYPSLSTTANTPTAIKVSLKNMGVNTINGATIYYSIDGGPAQSYNWLGSLAGQSTVEVTLTTQAQFTQGYKQIKSWVGDTLQIGSNYYIDHEPFNDTCMVNLIACAGPMSGVRNVGGPNPDYNNIDEILEALTRCGVNGPLTIRIDPNVYNRQIVLPSIPGASATNMVTFEPMNGFGTVKVITPNGATCALDLQNTSYVKFKNFIFTTPNVNSISTPYVVRLGINTVGCVFDSCTFVDSTLVGVSSLLYTGGASYFTIDHSSFKGAVVALNLMGSAADNCATNNSVYRSYFELSRESCIRATNQINLIIDSNYLNDVATNPSFVLMLQTCHGESRIVNNKVYSTHGASCFGATGFKGNATGYAIVANNMFVAESDLSTTVYTPVNIMNTEKMKYVYNSSKVNVPNYSNISAATIGGSGASDIYVLNNIFVSENPNNYAFNFIPSTTNYVLDHNLYYSPGTVLNRYASSQASSLSAWKNIVSTESGFNRDTNSIFASIIFLNTTPVDLRSVTLAIQNAGTPVDGITTDMFGTARGTTPCIGAYESMPLINNIALEEVLSPFTSCSLGQTEKIKVVLKNHGYATIPANSATFYYRHNNGTIVNQVINREILPSDTIHFTATNTINLSVTNIREDRNHEFKIWVALSTDDDKSNDTILHSISSLYQLPAINNQNLSIPYLTNIQLSAIGATDSVYWYKNDTITTPFYKGLSYLTDTLYRDTTYYLSQRKEIPLVKITEIQYNKSKPGMTYPLPSYMLSNVNFAVELANLGNYPAYIGGDTLLAVSRTNSYNNKVVVLPDIVLQPGATFVVQYINNGNITDPQATCISRISFTAPNTSNPPNMGFIYKSNGVIKDAVVLNQITGTDAETQWWTSKGVPSSIWTGNNPMNVESAGIRRINPTSNSASGWVACTGAPNNMSIGSIEDNMLVHRNNGCLGYRSSINITVQNIPQMNLALSNVQVSNQGCSLYDESISLELRNLGTGAVQNPVLQYSVDGVLYPADTLDQTLNSFSSLNHTFTSLADLRSYNINRVYELKVWVHAVSGDNMRDNDTVVLHIPSNYTPDIPIIDTLWQCEYGTVDTLYSLVPLRDTLVWYDADGNLLHIGNVFITDTLYDDVTYRVGARSIVYDYVHLGELTNRMTASEVSGPYNSSFTYRKEQYIVKAEELAELGYNEGIIQHLAFYLDTVANPTGQAVYTNYSIYMGTTTSNAFTNTNNFFNTFLVYSKANDTINNSQKGWRNHVLDSAFAWDGESNLVVQVYYQMEQVNGKIRTRYTNAAANTVLYRGANTYFPADTIKGVTRSAKRPDMKFGFVDYACEGQLADIRIEMINVPDLDISVNAFTSLAQSGNYSGDTISFGVVLANQGVGTLDATPNALAERLDTLLVSWELDGVLMGNVLYSGILTSGSVDTFTVATTSFTPGTHCIKVYVHNSRDIMPINDTIEDCFLFCFPAGTQYIGQGQDYSTFNQAVTSLINAGICGPVVFEVSPGTYNEQVIIPEISGLDSVNTITFRSSTGNYDDVILTYTPDAQSSYVLKFDNTHDISFENISVISTSTLANPGSSAHGNVLVVENSNNLQFIGNRFVARRMMSSTNANAITLSGIVSDIVISNNVIDSSYSGIVNKVVESTDNTVNITISNNLIKNFYLKGIDFNKVVDVDILKNRIESSSSANGKALTGIYLKEHYGAFDILQNVINLVDNRNGLKQGIYIGMSNSDAMNPSRLYNNMISIIGTGSATIKSTGLSIENSSYINVYFNTTRVQAGAKTPSSSGAEFKQTNNIAVKNNLFSNFGNGYAYYVLSPDCVSTSDFNNYYSNSTSSVDPTIVPKLVYWGQDIDSLANLIALSSKDMSSVDIKPYFRTTTDLHLSSGTTVGMAEYLTDVTVDIDDAVRLPIPRPTIGAHEYKLPIHDLAILEILSPVVKTADNSGQVYATTELVESDTMMVVLRVINNGSSLESEGLLEASINGTTLNSGVYQLPAMNPQEIIVDTLYIPMVLGILDTQIVFTQVFCPGDTSLFNDTISNQCFLFPAFDLQATSTIVNVGDGCRLYEAPVTIKLKNVGRKQIPTTLPIELGFQATFKSQSGSTVSPATLPTQPFSETQYLSVPLDVNTEVDVLIQQTADIYPHGLIKDIKVDVRSWANLMYDVKQHNDTTNKTTVTSNHTPVTPVGQDTVIPYSTLVELHASQSQNRPIRWHIDSLQTPFYEHSNYNVSRDYTLEHILFRDTVFFLSSVSPSGCTSYYDPIHVTVQPNVQYNVSPIAIEEPVNKVYMSRDTIKVRLKNYGTEQLTSMPVTYTKHRANNETMEYQQVTETCNAIIQPGGEYVFAFDSLADFSIITGNQDYKITIWTDLQNEETRENDTIELVVTPINENIYCTPEVSSASGMDITSVRVGTLENNIPAIGHTYLNFVNYANPNIPTLSLYKNLTDTLFIRAQDNESYEGRKFGFVRAYIDWNRDGLFNDSIEQVMVSDTLFSGEFVSGEFTVPSDAYYGHTRMRIILNSRSEEEGYNPIRDTNAFPREGVCPRLTNGCVQDYLVNIREPLSQNLALVRIIDPIEGIFSRTDSIATIRLLLANYGVNTISNVDINYAYNGDTSVYTWTGSLVSMQSAVVELPEHTFAKGTTIFSAWINPANDMDTDDNYVSKEFHRFHQIQLEYEEGFEDVASKMYAPSGKTKYDRNLWEIGAPTKNRITTAKVGTNAVVTDLDATINVSDTYGNRSILYTPFFDIGQVKPDTMSFWMNRNIPEGALLKVEYLNYQSKWKSLGSATDGKSDSWFDGGTNFTGNSQGYSYEKKWYPLTSISAIGDFSQYTQLRFIYYVPEGTASGDGVAIDEFKIKRAQRAIDVGVVDIPYPTEPKFGQTISPKIVIKNYGYDTIRECVVAYHPYGSALPKRETWVGVLPPNDTVTYQFSDTSTFTIQKTFPDTFAICAYTINEQDLYWDNDSACLNFYLSPLDIDAGLAEVVRPAGEVIAGDSIDVIVKVRNFGSTPIETMRVSYEFNGEEPVYETINFIEELGEPLQTFEYYDYVFDQKIRAVMGVMEISAATMLNNDEYVYNDSLTSRIYGISAVADITPVSVVLTQSFGKVYVGLKIANVGSLGVNNFQLSFYYDNDTSTLVTETYFVEGNPLPALDTIIHVFDTILPERSAPYDVFKAFVYYPFDVDNTNDTVTLIEKSYTDMRADTIFVEENENPNCRVRMKVTNVGTSVVGGPEAPVRLRATVNDQSLSVTWTEIMLPNMSYEIMFDDLVPKNSERHYVGNGNVRAPNDTVTTNNETDVVMAVDYFGLPGVKEETMVLEQNYPNPFSEFTTIDFSIPTAGNVRFFVVNTLGRLVYQKEDFYAEGRHSIDFSYSDLSTGIYYYGIEFEGKRLMKKMIFRK